MGVSIDKKTSIINPNFDYQEVTKVFIPQKEDTCAKINPENWCDLFKTIFVFENDFKLENRKLNVIGKHDIENNYKKIFK